MRIIYLVTSVLANAGEKWSLSWPYGEDGSCKCSKAAIGPIVFDTEASCVEAFVDFEFETCHDGVDTDTSGFREDQCQYAVAREQGLRNSDCLGMCTQVVAGEISLNRFKRSCELEFIVQFDDSVALSSSSCFDNLIYGHSDFNRHSIQGEPLEVYKKVPSATLCQELCQAVPDCVHWSWRALSDPQALSSGFQNPPLTCILHSLEYMKEVLSVNVGNDFADKYCDRKQLPSNCRTTEINNLLDTSCLVCGCISKCVRKSPVHVSGPAFCQNSKNPCAFERRTWTTTVAPICQENPVGKADLIFRARSSLDELQTTRPAVQLTTETGGDFRSSMTLDSEIKTTSITPEVGQSTVYSETTTAFSEKSASGDDVRSSLFHYLFDYITFWFLR